MNPKPRPPACRSTAHPTVWSTLDPGGRVTMNAGNDLTQNAPIFGAKGVTATANGAFIFGPGAGSGRQPVVYRLAGVEVAPPLSGAQVRANASVVSDSVVAFLDLFGRAQRRQRADAAGIADDAVPNRRRNRDAIVSEEQTCRP